MVGKASISTSLQYEGVVNYFTGSTGFGVQSELEPPPTALSTPEEEKELRLLMSVPTKEELRRLVKEMKKSAAQNSPSNSVVDQENTLRLSQDAQDPYHEFSPYN